MFVIGSSADRINSRRQFSISAVQSQITTEIMTLRISSPTPTQYADIINSFLSEIAFDFIIGLVYVADCSTSTPSVSIVFFTEHHPSQSSFIGFYRILDSLLESIGSSIGLYQALLDPLLDSIGLHRTPLNGIELGQASDFTRAPIPSYHVRLDHNVILISNGKN